MTAEFKREWRYFQVGCIVFTIITILVLNHLKGN